jgi:hypothetical protein
MLGCSTYCKVTAHNNKRLSRNRDVCFIWGSYDLKHLPTTLLNYYTSCSCYNLTQGEGEKCLSAAHTTIKYGSHNNKRHREM